MLGALAIRLLPVAHALVRALARAAAPRWALYPGGLLYRGDRLGPAPESWRRVLRRDPCFYCGGPGGTVDHIVPLSRRGPDTPANLTGACKACNTEKLATPLLLFLIAREAARLQRQPRRVLPTPTHRGWTTRQVRRKGLSLRAALHPNWSEPPTRAVISTRVRR